VDEKIKTAIALYEKKVQAQTQHIQKGFTHIPRVEEITAVNKVQIAVAALDTRITDIANMEKISYRPTKIVQAVIDLQVDTSARRQHEHLNTILQNNTPHTPTPTTNLIALAPQSSPDKPGPSTTRGDKQPARQH
jgi:hypothetical protein